MKRALFLLFFIILPILNSYSCNNFYYALDKEGNLITYGYNWKYPFNKNFNLERNVQKLKTLEKKLQKEKTYMLLSDYSVCLMRLGKQKEALDILKVLYNHYPNEYKIAANLGTAYELNGQVDSALKYIKRDLQLNPNDHEGSEWIHVKILETKLELRKNPSFLNDHTVLQLTEKQKKDSVVLQQISIQLQERVPYTPNYDDIMASLFTDLGDISANIKSIEYARAYYQIAKNYYGSKSPTLDAKIKDMEKLINKYTSVQPSRKEYFEGSKEKIGFFRYTELLDDNDYMHYKIKWDKINTDVPSLLALVDFSKTVVEIKDSITNNATKQTDELNLIPESTIVAKADSVVKTDSTKTNAVEDQKQKSNSKHYPLIYILASIIIVFGIGYFIINRKK